MKEDLATYLLLAPEFGGTRFGPFEGAEIALGSDKTKCDITLPESLGVLPVHVKVIRQADNSLIVTPVERTATIFLYKAQSRRPTQVNTPTAVVPGDSFALVTERGPRFIIELGELPPQVKAQREQARSKRRSRLSGAAFANEAKRQAWTKVLVTGPGQFLQRAYTFIKSGTIFQPRYIFLFVAIGFGYVFGGVQSCRIGSLKGSLGETSRQLDNCNKDNAVIKEMGEADATVKIPLLIGDVTSSHKLARALEEDDTMLKAVKEASRNLLSQVNGYKWLIEAKDARASRFALWREQVEKEEGLDTEIIRVAPYIGAEPNNSRSDWSSMEDSTQVEVCTRGTPRLTFRQGLHLGLTVQADAFASSGLGDFQSDKARREQALLNTLKAAGIPDLPEAFNSVVEPMGRGKSGCVFIEGEDHRVDDTKVIQAMVEHLGEKGAGLPPQDSAHSVTARIAKFYAADIPDRDFRDKDFAINFAEYPTGTVLNGMETKGAWVLRRTAETIARSAVLPCAAVLQNPKEAEKVFGKLPNPVTCLILDYKLRNEE